MNKASIKDNFKKIVSINKTIRKKIQNRTQVIKKFSEKVKINEKKEGMVVYHAMTAYHFLGCITDKLANNKDKTGVFIISVYLSRLYPNYMELVSRGIFNHILIYDIIDYSKSNSVSEFEQQNKEYFDKLLSSVSVNINEFDQIHIMGAHHGFGSYVCMNNLNFFFYEEAAGILSTPNRISNFEKSYYPYKGMVTERDGLFEGKNNLIIEVRCHYDSQNMVFLDKKSRNFEVTELLSKLDNSLLKFILMFFNVPNDVPFKQKNMIVLGEMLSSQAKDLKEIEYIRTYQLLIDYYSEGENIIFKPHPADNSEYERYFNDIYVMRDKFPSELLLFLKNANYQVATTITSTSMQTIEGNIESKRRIGYWFIEFKEIMNRCWLSFSIVSQLGNDNTRCYYYGIRSDQIQNWLLYNKEFENITSEWLPLTNIPENSISIIDDINWAQKDNSKTLLENMKKMNDSSVIIFINQYKDYCFYDINEPELMKYIIPMTISKKRLKNDIVDLLQDETIYVYTKNDEIRDKLMHANIEKSLNQTGVHLTVNPISGEKLDRLQLETKVSAMEYKLKKLMNT